MLTTAITVIHVLACFFLILVVLLQAGQEGGLGAMFGGGSQSAFGSAGAGGLFINLTSACAVIVMFSSLILAVFSSIETPSVIHEQSAPSTAPLALPKHQAVPETKPTAEGDAPVSGVGEEASAPVAVSKSDEGEGVAPAELPAGETARPSVAGTETSVPKAAPTTPVTEEIP